MKEKKLNWYVNTRKYHFIYRTTCKVNGKFYYGMHSTDDLADGYIGSGTRLWHSIKKHGRENFSIEILEFLPDRESLKKREAELITEELLQDPLCMNLTFGGGGGWELINSQISPEEKLRRRKLGGSVAGKLTGHQNHWKTNRTVMLDNALKGVTAAATKTAVAKRIETFRKIGHQKGELNSQFGKRWMNKDGNVVRVSEAEASQLEMTGWKRGKK